MKRAASTATETEFNWQAVSKPYSDAITRLVGASPEVAEGA
jgi:hypothetical protein